MRQLILLLLLSMCVHTSLYAQDEESPRVRTARKINHVEDEEKPSEKRQPRKKATESTEDEDGQETRVVRRKGRMFPFIVNHVEAQYDLNINLSDSSVIKKYRLLFEKHHLPFTSEIWEEILTQMVESVDPYLSQIIVFRADDEALLIGTGNPTYQDNFIEGVYPLLNNLASFDQFLNRIDKGRLPDE